MPKYRIKDSITGKTVIVSGDSAPTEADAESLFGQAGLRNADIKNDQKQKGLLEQGMGIAQGVGDFIAPKTTAAITGGLNTAGMIKDYIDYSLAKTNDEKRKEALSFAERKNKANESFKQFGFDDTKKSGEQFNLGKFIKGSTAGGGELASLVYNPAGSTEKLVPKLLVNAVPGITNAIGNDKDIGGIVGEGILSAVLGSSFEKALPFLGGLTKKTMSVTSGVGDEAVERALTNPKGVRAAMRGETNIYSLIPEVRDAVKKVYKDKIDEYGKGFEAIKNKLGNEKIDIKPFKKIVEDTVNKFGAVVKKTKDGLDFSTSSISNPSEAKKITTLVNDIKNWKDTSLQGMDTLYQRIRNTYDKGASNKFNAIVTDLYHKLEDEIQTKVPELAPLKKQYAKDSALLDAVKGRVEGVGAEGTLSNLFGKNKTEVRALFEALKNKSGTDVLNKVKDAKAGQKFSPLFPATGSRTLDILRSLVTAGATGAAGGPLAAIPGLLGSSPRVTGEVLTTVGSAMNNKTLGPLLKAILSGSNQTLRQVGFGTERQITK